MNPAQPTFLKGGIILFDVESEQVTRLLPMMVNPSSMRRSFESKRVDGGSAGMLAPLRLTGPAVESIDVEVQLDAADAILRGYAGVPQSGTGSAAAAEGVRPWIAALQMLVTPTSAAIRSNEALQASGALEIVPMAQPLTLFVWGANNLLPVVITSLSVNEEMFDPRLIPVKAKVSLGMKSLSVDELGVGTKAGAYYMAYLQAVERRAALVPDANPVELGSSGAVP